MTDVRKMIGALVAAAPNEQESRAFVQQRVTALFKLMFWSFVGLVAFLAGLYTVYPGDAPDARISIYVLASVALAAMAFIWRVLLLRRALSVTALHRLD